jgi:superfamily II DNA or RNA helicase
MSKTILKRTGYIINNPTDEELRKIKKDLTIEIENTQNYIEPVQHFIKNKDNVIVPRNYGHKEFGKAEKVSRNKPQPLENIEFKGKLKDNQIVPYNSLINHMKENSTGIFCLQTGLGKCSKINTPIIMFDGSIKKVQDIVVGDLLMGDDSKPKKVLTLVRGYDDMYKVSQKKGDSYTVNKEHIICLKSTNNEIFEISVKNYINLPKDVKKNLKGYKVPVEFDEKPLETDPYDFGMKLGKKEYCKSGIPLNYKCNSRKNRLELLAGLLDAIVYSNHILYFYFEHKSEELIDDVMYLCRSLGISVSKEKLKEGDKIWFCIRIAGDITRNIPVRKETDKSVYIKDDLLSDIKVKLVGKDNYYGFVIDGNHRYLMGDFTVTHNCHGKGTEILMYNGLLMEVENIKPYDLIMGDDSTPRTVLTTCRGFDMLYDIYNIYDGTFYTVNKDHILCLKNHYQPTISICFITGLWKVKWYDLGLRKKIFENKPEATLFYNYIVKNRQEYVCMTVLEYINLDKNRKYLKGYKKSVDFMSENFSKKNRFEYFHKYINNRDALMDSGLRKEILFIGNSLGIKCKINRRYKLLVDLQSYKKVKNFVSNNIIYDATVLNDINVVVRGYGQYYGFELSGNRKYILGDCTVTHNTVLALKLIGDLKVKTLIVSCSINQVDLMEQWQKSIKLFLGDHCNIGVLRGKKIDYEDKDVILTTITSLTTKDYTEKIFKGIGMVIMDECFTAFQKVITSDGALSIYSIYCLIEQRLGIEVLSYNIAKKRYEYKPATFGWKRNKTTDIYNIYIGSYRIETTENHYFLLLDNTWKKAKELTPDDELRNYTQEDGFCKITQIDITHYKTDLFDIEVADNHNFVLESGIVAHNCHHINSRSFSNSLFKVGGIKYALGITATPQRKDGMDKILNLWLGEPFYKSERSIKGNQPSVKTYKLHSDEYKEFKMNVMGKSVTNYAKTISHLIDIKSRNEFIVEKIKECIKDNRILLVLTDRIKHVKMLYNMVNDEENVGMYIGTEMKSDEKKASMTKKVIIATVQSFGEGIDKQELDTLLLASPKKFDEKSSSFIQIIGRIFRKEHKDTSPLIIDILDNFSIFKYQGYSRDSFYKKHLKCPVLKENVYLSENIIEEVEDDITESSIMYV